MQGTPTNIGTEEDPWIEPQIVVNGIILNKAQAMTLRVAAGSFQMLAKSEHGLGDEDMRKIYETHIDAIISFMLSMPSQKEKS